MLLSDIGRCQQGLDNIAVKAPQLQGQGCGYVADTLSLLLHQAAILSTKHVKPTQVELSYTVWYIQQVNYRQQGAKTMHIL
jgi:hypothetical protein